MWCEEPLCSRQPGLAHQHNREHGKNMERANSWLYSTNIKNSELKINFIAKSGQERSHGLAYMKFKGYFQDKRIKNSLERNIQGMSEVFLAFTIKVSEILFWAVNLLCQWNYYWSNHDIQKYHFDVIVTNNIWKSQFFCGALFSYLCVPMPEWNYKFRKVYTCVPNCRKKNFISS